MQDSSIRKQDFDGITQVFLDNSETTIKHISRYLYQVFKNRNEMNTLSEI